MSKNELIEQQLNEILERYHLTYWKKEGLEELAIYARKEKEHWESIDNKRMTHDMSRIIELSETLTKTVEA
ncbi:hypothetical protein [Sulfurovum sp.]|uniref:hypothetical protein n=1 Tax=Sulfurovum sp. TaxID=1969726 RepID=UPI00356B0826